MHDDTPIAKPKRGIEDVEATFGLKLPPEHADPLERLLDFTGGSPDATLQNLKDARKKLQTQSARYRLLGNTQRASHLSKGARHAEQAIKYINLHGGPRGLDKLDELDYDWRFEVYDDIMGTVDAIDDVERGGGLYRQ